MSETTDGVKQSVSSGFRIPFGCSFFLLDFIAVVYIISHWAQVSLQIAHLIQMVP